MKYFFLIGIFAVIANAASVTKYYCFNLDSEKCTVIPEGDSQFVQEAINNGEISKSSYR